jgi:hypothetical protein
VCLSHDAVGEGTAQYRRAGQAGSVLVVQSAVTDGEGARMSGCAGGEVFLACFAATRRAEERERRAAGGDAGAAAAVGAGGDLFARVRLALAASFGQKS